MNLSNNKIKRSLSFIIVFALIFSFIAPMTGLKVEAANEVDYQVKVRVEGKDSTFVKPITVNINSLDLSQYPGIEKPASDYDSLRAIHGIVKALEKSGIDPKDRSKFNITSNGNYITMINGLAAGEMSGWMYRVDNKNADAGAGDYKIKNGQEVVVFYVEDFMDNIYSWFDKESIITDENKNFELVLNGHAGFDESTPNKVVEGATILVDGKEYKKDGQVLKTDSNGRVSLSLKETGTYHISASKKNAKGQNIISRPYTSVKVNKASAVESNKIKSIEGVKDIEVDLKTTKEKVLSSLPKTTNIVDSGGKKHIVDLKWTLDNYSGEKIGQYKAVASFILPEGVVQTEPKTELSLTTKIVVKAKEATNSTNVDKAIEKTVNYYKNNNPLDSNGDWEAYIGLWGVDKTIDKEYQWESIDPGFGSNISTNETITYAYSLLAKGKDPSNIWGGRNLFKELSTQQRKDGVFTNIGKHIFAMLLLDTGREMGADVGDWNDINRQRAIDGLLKMQNKDGSFGSFSYLDHTGWSLIALSEYRDQANVHKAIDKAIGFLKEKQTDNGSFDYNDGSEKGENSNSISVVIQGLVAIGEDVLNPNGPWAKNGNTPVDALLRYQRDDGSFLWRQGTNITGPTTKQAMVALADIKNGRSTWHRLGKEVFLSSVGEKDVKALISDINKLPKEDKITFDDKINIMKAYNKYLQLPEKYRSKVTNSLVLLKAKETLDKIENKINAINDGIWELPGNASDISLKHKEKVLDLIKQYNSLSDSDKKHIKYYDELKAAKAQIDKLLKEEEIKEENEENEGTKAPIKDSNNSNNSPKTGDEGIVVSIILFITSLFMIIFLSKRKKIS